MGDLTRRSLFCGVAASALVAGMPAIPAISAVVAQPVPLKAFIVGTPGEYDWQHYIARTAEEAFAYWREERADEDEEAEKWVFDPDSVQRVEEWDGRSYSSIKPADWFRAGLGHICDRCGYETHPDFGGVIICEEVVCADCLTSADYAALSVSGDANEEG